MIKAKQQSNSKTKYRLMIADDEKRVCQLIYHLIEWNKLELEFAGFVENGDEALEQVRKQQIDILITDIRMPGLDGLGLIEEIRSQDEAMEILIISGYNDFEYVQKALQNGARDYILKPVSRDRINEALTLAIKNLNKKNGMDKNWNDAERVARVCKELLKQERIEDYQYCQYFGFEISREILIADLKKRIRQGLQEQQEVKLEQEMNFEFRCWLSDNIVLLLTYSMAEGYAIYELFERTKSILLEQAEITNIYFSNRHTDIKSLILGEEELRNTMPIKMAKEYIQQNYANNISLEMVADYVGLNPSYFSALFKKQTKINFMEYVKWIRIEEAKKLLSEGNRKIGDIINRVGYYDDATFYKNFKKVTGIKPNDYRKMLV